MIICDNVTKFKLRNVDLHVPYHTVVGLIGASSAGKTTFLKLAAGLLKPESGEIYTDRTNPVWQERNQLEKMAVLFTDIPVFQEGFSIRSHFDEIEAISHVNKTDFESKLLYISKALGFDEIMGLKPEQLSLGQRRRAELGTVMVRDANLYILDEPCIGLDQNGKFCLYEMIKKKKKEGATAILSSHSMADIASVADRVIFLHEGSVVFYGSQEELYKRVAPIDECHLEYEGDIPDISQLETEAYSISNNKMVIRYNSNHVSSKEVLLQIAQNTKIKSVNIRKSDLSECIKKMQIKGERK